MCRILILLSIMLTTACTAKTENMSQYYPEHVIGSFYLTEDMALFESNEHNYSFVKTALARQSDCCTNGKQLALLPKGTKVQINSILRFIKYNNDCNEAAGSVQINGKEVDFEFFINCNYQGVKVAKDLPWKREP